MQDEQPQNPASTTPAIEEPETLENGLTPAEQEEWDSANQQFAEDNDHPLEKAEEEAAKGKDKDKPEELEKESKNKPEELEKESKNKPEELEKESKNKPEDKPEEPKGESEEEPPTEDRTIRDARAVQRELDADKKQLSEDIRGKMFSDVPTELQDEEGDPIKSVQDMMKLNNPNTGKPFTEEEGAAWLLAAREHLDKQLTEVDKKIEIIAETNLSLKDEADNIRSKYGELFKSMPDLQKQVWAAYQDTLVRDKDTGIITDAPVSMEGFYDMTLRGYIELARHLNVEAVDKEKAEKEQAEAEKKKEEEHKKEIEKVQTQNDREDIYSGGKTDTRNKEEKEWDQAAKEYYDNA